MWKERAKLLPEDCGARCVGGTTSPGREGREYDEIQIAFVSLLQKRNNRLFSNNQYWRVLNLWVRRRGIIVKKKKKYSLRWNCFFFFFFTNKLSPVSIFFRFCFKTDILSRMLRKALYTTTRVWIMRVYCFSGWIWRR